MSNDFIGSIDGPEHLAVVQENERLRQRVEELEKQVKVQGFNLQLRNLDGSMDVDELIKDAERWRNVVPYLDDKLYKEATKNEQT